MLKTARLFKAIGFLILVNALFICRADAQQDVSADKSNASKEYREFFEQTIYYEGTQPLRFDRSKRGPSSHVNVHGQVPDGLFFTNRHARSPLSASQLENGFQETKGPDLSKPLTIIAGVCTAVEPKCYRVRDARGDDYVITFDSANFPELLTSSQIIANRFYYAIGYNVAEMTILAIDSAQLVLSPTATHVDNSGFESPLTQEKLERDLLFAPVDSEGRYRVLARRISPNEKRTNSEFKKHTKDREFRALQVFASWLNHTGLRETNIAEVGSDAAGKKLVLVEFGSALGAGPSGAKTPEMSHEFWMDFGETFRSFITLGMLEKPWQKRWREVNEKINPSSAVGYFDNRYFDPKRFKTDLPYNTLKNITSEDGAWAAKIIVSFSDSDIDACVKAGRLSHPEDASYLANVLKERRDLIAKYWNAGKNA